MADGCYAYLNEQFGAEIDQKMPEISKRLHEQRRAVWNRNSTRIQLDSRSLSSLETHDDFNNISTEDVLTDSSDEFALTVKPHLLKRKKVSVSFENVDDPTDKRELSCEHGTRSRDLLRSDLAVDRIKLQPERGGTCLKPSVMTAWGWPRRADERSNSRSRSRSRPRSRSRNRRTSSDSRALSEISTRGRSISIERTRGRPFSVTPANVDAASHVGYQPQVHEEIQKEARSTKVVPLPSKPETAAEVVQGMMKKLSNDSSSSMEGIIDDTSPIIEDPSSFPEVPAIDQKCRAFSPSDELRQDDPGIDYRRKGVPHQSLPQVSAEQKGENSSWYQDEAKNTSSPPSKLDTTSAGPRKPGREQLRSSSIGSTGSDEKVSKVVTKPDIDHRRSRREVAKDENGQTLDLNRREGSREERITAAEEDKNVVQDVSSRTRGAASVEDWAELETKRDGGFNERDTFLMTPKNKMEKEPVSPSGFAEDTDRDKEAEGDTPRFANQKEKSQEKNQIVIHRNVTGSSGHSIIIVYVGRFLIGSNSFYIVTVGPAILFR
ncbi:uncharacterized protein BCR38DRAFT_405348 [Pseudomassariella vexata]|uniref:Uncharacterized protein n=1 Tax=Pseudomassariella vexata TaxID=1141098 RepID=A0A1Y2EDL8_9PEZI|nr:uncharacterized protein BCR38DRAFT_405348 [Pseudomassariella vexata]ORY69650.1 hypothetical protein BCR38DRAFT_405348 [Pseudomassariella vexata]